MNAIAQVSAAPTTGPKLDNRRVLAAIVDVLIVAAGALVVLVAGDSLSGDRQSALSVVILGWALYYYFALESGEGQTVGKKLMKLRVVCADGRPAGMREIAVRTILRVIDGIGMYIVGLVVMLVTGQRRQRLGDLAANTIVVDASAPAMPAPAPAPAPPPATTVEEEPETTAEGYEPVEADRVEDEPAAIVAEPTHTITLPSRPAPPATLSDLTEPDAPAAEVEAPAGEVEEPVADAEEPTVEVEEPVVEVEAPAEVEEPVMEADPVEPEPIDDLESIVPVPAAEEPAAAAEEAAAEVEEPVEDGLSPAMSPSLEGLAADVAAAQEQADGAEEAEEPVEGDGPVNVKSVETVSAMDLIMGAAEEDAANSDEDEAPASA